MPMLLPFSLTKYTVIFAEVKRCFGINYNQLGGLKRGRCLSTCSLMIQFVCIESILKNIWSKYCSHRSQCINQLERVIANGDWSNSFDSCRKWLNNQLKWITGNCCDHNCWVILDGKQQKMLRVNFCSQDCGAELSMKQKTFTTYVALLAPVLTRCKKHSSSLWSVAIIIAVVIVRTWVIVAVVIAFVAKKAWGLVTSFNSNWSGGHCMPEVQ